MSGDSDGESVSSEKALGMECRTGGGNARGEQDMAAEEGLSMGRSQDVELLVEASGSRVCSGVDTGRSDGGSVVNLLSLFLGGSFFGMQVVTQGN